jgi:YD repeat-containing protein
VVRAKGPITQVTSPSGKWLNFTYKTNNEVASVTDNLGRSVSYQYDTAGHVTQFVDAGTNPTLYTYDSSGRLATTKDGRGTVYSTNDYDAAGRVATQTDADGNTYQMAYTTDTSGKVTETRLTDPRGNVRRLTFNQAGFSTGDTHAFDTPNAETTTITRDPVTNLVNSTTDALNRQTDLKYDPFGNVTSVTQLVGTVDARSELFSYDGPFDQISRFTDWRGRATTYGYGPNSALRTITDPMSRVTTVDTAETGQVSKVTDNLAHATGYGYVLGDLSTVTDPQGRVSRQVVDPAGRVVATRDPTGSTTQVGYDKRDHVVSVTDPLGRVTGYADDANGNLTTFTDPQTHTTIYTFDLMKSVVCESFLLVGPFGPSPHRREPAPMPRDSV